MDLCIQSPEMLSPRSMRFTVRTLSHCATDGWLLLVGGATTAKRSAITCSDLSTVPFARMAGRTTATNRGMHIGEASTATDGHRIPR